MYPIIWFDCQKQIYTNFNEIKGVMKDLIFS